MSKKLQLITVFTKETISSKSKNLLFLGKWCEVNFTKRDLLKKKIKIVNYPWSNKLTRIKSHKKILKSYDLIKIYLTKHLNDTHKTNYSEKYWEQIFGHWLMNFTTIFHDKVEIINKLKNYKISNYVYLKLNPKDCMPINSFFSKFYFQNDYWNGYLFSLLLKRIRPDIKFKTKNISFKNGTYIREIKKTKSLKDYLRICLLKTLSIISLNNEKFIISSYLNTLNELKLQFLVNGCLKFNYLPKVEKKFKVNPLLRKNNFNSQKSKSLNSILKDLVLQFLPQSYLEGYQYYKLFSQNKLNWPKNPKIIFTSNAHFNNDIFKIWLAEKREQKIKFVAGQHGNGYIFPKYTSLYDRDVKTCDKFLFWGNKKLKNKKIKSNFNLVTTNKKLERQKKREHILMVQYFPYKFQNRLISTEHNLFDISKNINTQKKFISNLKEEYKSKIKIRLGFAEDFSNGMQDYEKKYWLNSLENTQLESRHKPISRSLRNCKMVIVNSIVSTVFTECLVYNIPCFIISNFERDMFSKECIDDFVALKNQNIIQNDPIFFSKFINKKYNEIDIWWNSKKVQSTIHNFRHNYCHTVKEPIKFLNKNLN